MGGLPEINRQLRPFIFFGIALFVIGILIGTLMPERFTPLLASVRELAHELRDAGMVTLVAVIFFKNVSAAFFSMWLGSLWGIVPVVSALTNGIAVGIIFAWSRSEILIFLGLLPHGIFELPAMFIAWGLGIWRGAWLWGKRNSEPYRVRAQASYRIFFMIILPLLVVAALIESAAITLLK